MRRVVLRAALAALCASAGLAPALAQSVAGPVTYQLDPNHTFVTFEVLHFGTSTLRGRIGPVTGEVMVDRAAKAGDVRLRIPVTTLDTGMRVLDARLERPDMLATAEYPEAYFVATQFHFDAVEAPVDLSGHSQMSWLLIAGGGWGHTGNNVLVKAEWREGKQVKSGSWSVALES